MAEIKKVGVLGCGLMGSGIAQVAAAAGYTTVVRDVADAFGSYEKAPKKSTVSLRRKKQFALLGPATRTHIEIGLNHKDLPSHPRLKLMPPGGMCPYTVRVASPDEVDADLTAWLRAAYDAAG